MVRIPLPAWLALLLTAAVIGLPLFIDQISVVLATTFATFFLVLYGFYWQFFSGSNVTVRVGQNAHAQLEGEPKAQVLGGFTLDIRLHNRGADDAVVESVEVLKALAKTKGAKPAVISKWFSGASLKIHEVPARSSRYPAVTVGVGSDHRVEARANLAAVELLRLKLRVSFSDRRGTYSRTAWVEISASELLTK